MDVFTAKPDSLLSGR